MPTVLLVDDEPVVLENLRYQLEKAGYTVLAANSGEAALRISRQHSGLIDVLVSDVLMHPMTGYELAAKIKSAHPKLIVILVSGSPDFALKQPAIASNFLQKPFPHRDLLAVISRQSQRHAIAGDSHEG